MHGRTGAGSRPRGAAGAGLPALTADEQRILAYASAIGTEFDFPILVAAMGADEETLAERLERLVRRGVLLERPGGERFAFAEESFRAGVYRALTESRLRILHRRLAEVIESTYPTPTPEIVAELGRHYFLGKVPARSYEYNRRAAEAARARGELDVAIHELERAALDLAALGGDRAAEQAEVAETLGDLCFATSNFPAADRCYREALERVGRDQPRIRARLVLARAEIAREKLDVPAAVRGAEEALPLFESTGDHLGIAQTYRLLGRVAFQQGAYRDSLEEGMRALDALPDSAPPGIVGRLSIDIGNAFAMLGDEVRDVAIEWYQRAADRLQAAPDTTELARALHNLGVTVGEVRPSEGLELLAQTREVAERIHDTRALGRALLSGVEMRLALGQVEEAERDNEQAGRLLERLADGLGLEQVLLNRGLIAERAGQWDDAAASYDRAAAMARANHIAADEAEAVFHLARLRYKTRDLAGARAAFDAATALKVTELSPRLTAAYDQLRRDLAGDGSASPADSEQRV